MKIELSAMAQRESDDHGLRAQPLEGELQCIGREADLMSRENALGLLFFRTVAAAVGNVTRPGETGRAGERSPSRYPYRDLRLSICDR